MSLSMTPHSSWAEPRVSPSLALTSRVTSNITHSVTLTGQMHALGRPTAPANASRPAHRHAARLSLTHRAAVALNIGNSRTLMLR